MSAYAWLFAIAGIASGFLALGLAAVIYIEEDTVEKKYSSRGLADVVNKAKDFGGDVEPKK